MGFLFETEIHQILHTVRGQTIGEFESITLREILVSPIHPALKTYFRAEVEQMLERERGLEVRSKRFPYAHPEVVSLQHQVDLLLIQHYQFPQGEFERALDDAVHFQFNYLCRPQFTLLQYIVGDRRRVSAAEISRKLARCAEYEYFPELIRRYLDERGLAEVTYEEFKGLLARIDSEVLSRHSSDELAAMTRGILSFVDFGRATPHDDHNRPTLPTNAAIVFFEDKGLENIKTRLELERDKRGQSLLTLEELTDLLRQVWSDVVDVGVERTTSRSTDDIVDAREVAGAMEPESATPDDGRMQGVVFTVPADPVADEPVLTPTPFSSLHDVFTRKDIKRFVKTIFRKDDKALRDALDVLNDCPAWDDASHQLDSLFVAQNVDPFSKEAVEFTDKIYSRFFPT